MHSRYQTQPLRGVVAGGREEGEGMGRGEGEGAPACMLRHAWPMHACTHAPPCMLHHACVVRHACTTNLCVHAPPCMLRHTCPSMHACMHACVLRHACSAMHAPPCVPHPTPLHRPATARPLHSTARPPPRHSTPLYSRGRLREVTGRNSFSN
jgi:hypothetical protein